LKYLHLLSGLFVTFSGTTTFAAASYQLNAFDPQCGTSTHNCLQAFQQAFKTLRKDGGGTLNLDAGTYVIDMPDVSDNVDPRASKPLRPDSLISVPPNVQIVGHTAPDGKPDTLIVWSNSSIPIFVFAGASNSGMRNIHAHFHGATPDTFPYGDEDVLRALGFHPTFPHLNEMSGGNYEMFTFILVFDSDHCTFDNLLFDSAQPDNDHAIGIAINLKGSGLLLNDGQGGLSELATGNQLSHLAFYDFIMGILLTGQDNVTVRDIVADRRASRKSIAPGHVIYTTLQNKFDAQGNATWMVNTNVHIDHVSEGPDVYSNVHALGTLAIKAIDGGSISDIDSKYPLGLINTLYAVRNVTFSNLSWQSDYDPCEHGDESCGLDVISFAQNDKDQVASDSLTFRNVILKSSRRHVAAVFAGSHLSIDGMQIESPIAQKDHVNSCSLCINKGDHAIIRNYVFRPVIASLDDSIKPTRPLACYPCHDLDAQVVTEWPAGVKRPPPGYGAITSDVHEREPEKQNVIVDTLRARN